MSLVEVLFALLILSTAVLSVVLLLPLGVRTLERSRYQMYAALKAAEIEDLVAQSRKNWRLNDLEIDDGAKAGHQIRTHTNVFAARSAPDLEQTLLRESGSCMPVPAEIARRLDSPDGLIGRVLDEGGLLFYPDPFPTRDALRQSARFGSLTAPVPELQKLVFAVVTPAQQNQILNHPSVAWPYYEIIPFPPQAKVKLPSWKYTAINKTWTDSDGKTWNYAWSGPVKSSAEQGERYQGHDWQYMATTHPGTPWAQNDALTKFRNLCYYGWTPLWFKISFESGSVGHDPNEPVTGIADNKDPRLPPKPPGPSHWRGERIQEDIPEYFASVPAEVEAARVALNAAYEPDYTFDQEKNMRLPSLGMRRFYRQLALDLWNAVGGSIGNPLTDDLTGVPVTEMHPARLLAMSYLADAAMIVTGYRLPYINTKGDTGTGNDVDLNAPAVADNDHRTYVGQVPNQFAAHDAEAEPDGVLKAGVAPTALEDEMAQRVHENLMHWYMRHCSTLPYDWHVPRPANRQQMMDQPLLMFDLFDAAGNARRTPSSVAVGPANQWPDEGNAAESCYPVLFPPRYDGAGPYRGFGHLFGGGADDRIGDLGLYSNFRAGVDALRSPNSDRWWFDQPFAPSQRARLLVFWAVDWKSYEDAESAPSLAMDARMWNLGGDFRKSDAILPEDHPEAALLWTNADRNARNLGDSDSQSFYAFAYPYWYGQFGADRNGNGAFDVGGVPRSTRMKATEVARFIVYDPVTYRSLRR